VICNFLVISFVLSGRINYNTYRVGIQLLSLLLVVGLNHGGFRCDMAAVFCHLFVLSRFSAGTAEAQQAIHDHAHSLDFVHMHYHPHVHSSDRIISICVSFRRCDTAFLSKLLFAFIEHGFALAHSVRFEFPSWNSLDLGEYRRSSRGRK